MGRDNFLLKLEGQLQQTERDTISVLKGMGGVGKTELALQYAWTAWKRGTYPGGICWLTVAEGDPSSQIFDYAKNYLKLNLPDEGTLAERVRYCWHSWLAGDALIIFNDVRDFEHIKHCLPPNQERRFKVLITTRLNFLLTSEQTIDVLPLEKPAALDLLRSYVTDGRIDLQLDHAEKLCRDLGYLPLALELVARLLKRRDWTIAKIQEKLAANGLEDQSLRKDPKFDQEMTAEWGVKPAFDLSWQELKEEPKTQLLAQCLSLFALSPFPKNFIEGLFPDEDTDDIEKWLTDSLVNLNLVQDRGQGWYELHTLIRQYLRDKLEKNLSAQGEERIADRAKHRYCKLMANKSREMPQTPTQKIVLAFTPYFSHIQVAVNEFQDKISDEDLICSYAGLAKYYVGQGFYEQAQPWCEQCLSVFRERLGEEHPHVATSLNNLAEMHRNESRYEQAEPLHKRALAIREKMLGLEHPDVAQSLNNLALLYDSRGSYKQAEPLYKRALAIREKSLGLEHPDVAQSINNLASLYDIQGRCGQAEPLHKRALAIREKVLGLEHPDVAQSLNNLASLYYRQGRYGQAEPLFKRALAILEKGLGLEHPTVAASLNNLAGLYGSLGRYEQADPLHKRALAIQEKVLGPEHPDVAQSLNSLAFLYYRQGRCERAQPLCERALAIREKALGPEHTDVAQSLNSLAFLYFSQGRYEQAEPLFKRALAIRKKVLGPEHPDTITVQQNYTDFLERKKGVGSA